MGIVTGSYVYYLNTTEETSSYIPELNETPDFMVIAELYGGCMRGDVCASYRIVDDGSYTYIAPQYDEDAERVTGKLSRTELAELKQLVASSDLSGILSSTFGGVCPITYDGVAMKYDITIGGENYGIDTCMDDIGDDPLFSLLEEYFYTFERVHSK